MIASLKPHFTIIKPGFRYESGTVLNQVENRVVGAPVDSTGFQPTHIFEHVTLRCVEMEGKPNESIHPYAFTYQRKG
jgi:hypothetical protein